MNTIKALLAVLALMVFSCCGGCLLLDLLSDTKTTSRQAPGAANRPASSPTPRPASTPPGPSSSPEAERIYAEQFSKYQKDLAEWQSATELEQENSDALRVAIAALDDLSTSKPRQPPFETRTWSTVDGKHTMVGTLLSIDDDTAVLRKSDGSETPPIQKSQLVAQDRLYLDGAREEWSDYQTRLSAWELERDSLTNQIKVATNAITKSQDPKPSEPDRAAIESEVHTRHEAEQREIAEQKAKAAEQGQQELLDKYLATLETIDPTGSLFASVSVRDKKVTVTVKNAWHVQHYQVRFQGAQNLWKIWAAMASPSEPDSARISIVDLNDNEVGGSRMWGGSLVWVAE